MNTTLTPADLDPRRQAMLLYFQGYRVARIAEMLGEKVATVHSWKKRDKWGDYGPLDQMQLTTAARYCQLIMKEQKEGKDFKEIDLLARQSERHARIGKFNDGGNEADLNPKVANRNKGPRRQPEKNIFTDEQTEKLEEIFRNGMFEYQRHWWQAGVKHRIRNLLKSRQIGATYFFAREALIDAITIRGRFLVDQADGAQLFLPPLAAHLPQFAIPPVRAQHTGQRRWDQFIRHQLAAALFAAQLLKGRRDDLKAHSFCSNPFPCLADFFWFNIVTDKQITAGRIKTHAHMCRNQRGKALDLILIHFRQYQ